MEHPSCALWSGFERWFRILQFVRLVRGLTALRKLVVGVSKREERRTEPKILGISMVTVCSYSLLLRHRCVLEPGRMPFATQFIQLLSISEQRKRHCQSHNVKSASHE